MAHHYAPDKEPARAPAHARGSRRAEDPVHDRHAARDRRERRTSASTRCSRSAISPIATATSRKRSSSPSIRSPARACAGRRRSADAEVAAGWRSRGSCSGRDDERAGAAEPLARALARAAAARGRQRLGRRLAGDGRLHQPRGAVADARASCARRTEAAGQRAASSGCPSIPKHAAPARVLRAGGARGCAARRRPRLATRVPRSEPGGSMMLERLLAGVKPDVARVLERRARGPRARAPRRDALLAAQGADLHALLLRRRRRAHARTRATTSPTSSAATSTSPTSVTWAARSAASRATSDDADAYDRSMEQLLAKCDDAVARGATEVCIQGGIHPNKDHPHYREILTVAQGGVPERCTSTRSRPRRSTTGTRRAACRSPSYLRWLKDAGLGTIPGHRRRDPRRLDAPPALAAQAHDRALESRSSRAAHRVGLRSTSTMMYGHIEKPHHVARHLELIREIQKETGGFTEFVPLGFIHEKNALFHVGHHAARSVGAPRTCRLIAVARLFLRPWITNVQMSWVKMGPKLAQVALHVRRQRLRRHADGGVDQPRVRLASTARTCPPRRCGG